MTSNTTIRETAARSGPGLLILLLLIVLVIAFPAAMIALRKAGERLPALLCGLGFVATLVGMGGFFVVEPNQAAVLTLFGNYKGSERRSGLWWNNPFMTKKKVTLRVRNFESNKLKVNDHDGNPIEIAAVVVWKVVDSAEAIFQVDNYEHFVNVQSEAALRNLATAHPYDGHEDAPMSLRGNTAAVAEALKVEVQARLEKAGVEVLEARISHLAYAPEIANAMLRRQQASAVIAARAKIVEGAVSMVEMALAELNKRDVVHLDEERKAAMVSNLLVVLCSESEAQPIVNTGTLHT
jgi:regulator of protease activity HflC (stomatin/prohibitin superfamily)